MNWLACRAVLQLLEDVLERALAAEKQERPPARRLDQSLHLASQLVQIRRARRAIGWLVAHARDVEQRMRGVVEGVGQRRLLRAD